MAKFWTPGTVKTRLGASTGMDKSARLHQLFVQTLTTHLAGGAQHCVVSFAPSEKEADFADSLPADWQLTPQCDGDLGQRMQDWFTRFLGEQSAAILIGADCPTLDQSVIDLARELLETNDVVLGPANDGGYYLIGIRGPWLDQHAALFKDVPWSTDTVLSLTQKRIALTGMSCELLSQREDIDTIDVLHRLIDSLKQTAPNQSSHARLLRQIESILNEPES